MNLCSYLINHDEDKEGNTMIHVMAHRSHISFFFVKFDTHISDDAPEKKNHRKTMGLKLN